MIFSLGFELYFAISGFVEPSTGTKAEKVKGQCCCKVFLLRAVLSFCLFLSQFSGSESVDIVCGSESLDIVCGSESVDIVLRIRIREYGYLFKVRISIRSSKKNSQIFQHFTVDSAESAVT